MQILDTENAYDKPMAFRALKKIYALILNFNETPKVGAKFMELPTNLLGWL